MSVPMIHADAADLHIPTSCAQALGLGEWLVSTDATKRSIGTRLLVEASGGTRPNALLTTPPNYMIGLTQPSSPTHHHSGYGHSFKGHSGSPCLRTRCQDPARGRALSPQGLTLSLACRSLRVHPMLWTKASLVFSRSSSARGWRTGGGARAAGETDFQPDDLCGPVRMLCTGWEDGLPAR